jgi:hypothetical protein
LKSTSAGGSGLNCAMKHLRIKLPKARREKIRVIKRIRNKVVAHHERKEETLPRSEVSYGMSILSSHRVT